MFALGGVAVAPIHPGQQFASHMSMTVMAMHGSGNRSIPLPLLLPLACIVLRCMNVICIILVKIIIAMGGKVAAGEMLLNLDA
jgi:hypothetical protein